MEAGLFALEAFVCIVKDPKFLPESIRSGAKDAKEISTLECLEP
jgi:hypothetical protein